MAANPQRRRGTRRREMVVREAYMRVWDEVLIQRMEKKLSPAEVVWVLTRLLDKEARAICRREGESK